MRLLYVIDSLAPGGAETSLAEMAPGLIARGTNLHVLPLGSRRDLAPRLEEAGAVVHVPRRPNAGRLSNVREVIRIAREIRPDLIHTTLFEADIAGRSAARILRLPASTSLVNDSYDQTHYAESNRIKLHLARALDAVTGRSVTRFHSITTAIATSVPPRLGLAHIPVDVIPRGRDPKRYPPRSLQTRVEVRAELGLDDATPVVLAIGRLEPQKGLEYLLAALPLIAEKVPDVICLIAGKDGRASATLRAQADALSVPVHFLGHRTDIARLLSAADVFCFPSEREGFGGVLIEAMAVGCPIVATAIPTTREVISCDAGHVGLLSPTRNATELAEHAGALLENRSLAEALSEKGRENYTANFTVDRICDQMAGFFAQCRHPSGR